jgi:hypothetical protein
VEERWVPDGGGGLRSFASEIVALIPILVHFARCVLKPMHKLLEHVECLELLFALTSLLFRDECVKQIPKMRHLLEAHHRLFARLYPLACRPKLHYLHHVVDGIERQQVHLNCFGSERKHKEAKAVASFCFRDFAVSIMQRCCLAHVEALIDPQAVQLNVLFGKLKRTRLGRTGKCMRHAAGLLSHKEFCMVEGVGHIIVSFECIVMKEAVNIREALPPYGSVDPVPPAAQVPRNDMHYPLREEVSSCRTRPMARCSSSSEPPPCLGSTGPLHVHAHRQRLLPGPAILVSKTSLMGSAVLFSG